MLKLNTDVLKKVSKI